VTFEPAFVACGDRRFDTLGVLLYWAGFPPQQVCGSIECYKVVPIRDPGLDQSGTNKYERFSNKQRQKKREASRYSDEEGSAGGKRERLDGNECRCCGASWLFIYTKPDEVVPVATCGDSDQDLA
jgi:hypothetical protein